MLYQLHNCVANTCLHNTNFYCVKPYEILFLLLNRLGQACNHVAALLFFIEHNAMKDELPTDTSTSQPMKWNQPPKKSILPACDNNMVFVRPSHGCLEESARIPRSSFDPCLTSHRTLNEEAAKKLQRRLCPI